jgi:hypothetical protein
MVRERLAYMGEGNINVDCKEVRCDDVKWIHLTQIRVLVTGCLNALPEFLVS